MLSPANLQAYNTLLQEQSELAEAMMENFAKLAEMAIALGYAGPPVAQLSSVPNVSQQPHALHSVPKQRRVRGVLAVVRMIVEEFSGPFDKNDIMAKLRERDSALAESVSAANLRNTLRILARSGDIKVETNATSTTCAKYVNKRVAA